MLHHVSGDIWSFVSTYGAEALALGIASFPIFFGIFRKNVGRCFYYSILISYLYLVASVTLLSREVGQYGDVDLTFFTTGSNISAPLAVHYIENFILLMPLGFLLPHGIKLFRMAFFGLSTGFAVSFLIECTQHYTAMGTFDLDDIVLNGLGFAAGYILWRIGNFLFAPTQDERIVRNRYGVSGRRSHA
ncbi:MAG: VanZ family protein [Lachnospiraceae bacterium]|nr:VanZ family protein [Lachnospiraceae bacterium]